jgi:glycosyltransferase involved in cell wall biosynthesis
MNPLSYVLITAARNEEAFIEKTLQSVISQTLLPLKWVIVSDGSTDRTDAIVQAYAGKEQWIELIRMPERTERHFAGKAIAFNTGFESVRELNYDIIGNIDADVSFEQDFVEYILDQFGKWPELGVAGTDYIEGDFHSFRDSYIDVKHVNGQCQFFRRFCFEEIGGYVPVKEGGIDWIAVTTARMRGWKTHSFSERVFTHHREMGTANGNILISRFCNGKKDYCRGSHPLWQFVRAGYQMTKKPYLVGGVFLLAGYLWASVRRTKKPVSAELMQFYRKEQIERLKGVFSGGLASRRLAHSWRE